MEKMWAGVIAPLARHRPRPSNNAGLLDRGQPDMDWSVPQLQARERGREREGIALAGRLGVSHGQVTATRTGSGGKLIPSRLSRSVPAWSYLRPGCLVCSFMSPKSFSDYLGVSSGHVEWATGSEFVRSGSDLGTVRPATTCSEGEGAGKGGGGGGGSRRWSKEASPAPETRGSKLLESDISPEHISNRLVSESQAKAKIFNLV